MHNPASVLENDTHKLLLDCDMLDGGPKENPIISEIFFGLVSALSKS